MSAPSADSTEVVMHTRWNLTIDSSPRRTETAWSATRQCALAALAACLVCGCASAPRASPLVAATQPATSSTLLAYAERAVCDDPESNAWLRHGSPHARTPCCPEAAQPGGLSLSLGSPDTFQVRLGHQPDHCGPVGIDTDFSREQSLSPSQRVQPSNELLQVSW